MGKYMISVITPCHNMDKAKLKRAFQSLKDQTIGFSNIEWLLVLHNESSENIENAEKWFASYPNIKIYVLNDGIKTPASPRNYALKHANGEYIGFLDADDAYTRSVCQTACMYLNQTEADVAFFRMETIATSGKEIAINCKLLLNQIDPYYVISTDSWDSKCFTCGVGLSITSKIYRRSIINQNAIRFDTSVPFASDTLFNLAFYFHMNKICVMTQLIGYQYYMGPNSIVQKLNKNKEDVYQIANGITGILNYGYSTSLDINSLAWELLSYQAVLLLTCKELTWKDRCCISNMLQPYFKNLKSLETNKVHPNKPTIAKYVLPHPFLATIISHIIAKLKNKSTPNTNRELEQKDE